MPKGEIQIDTELATRIFLIRGRTVMLDIDLARIEAPDEDDTPRREIGFHVKNARNSRPISLLDK